MDLLDKLRAIERRQAKFAEGSAMPGLTVIDRVLGPCEVVVRGRPTLMFGSNNYLGLTQHPDVVEAARRAVVEYGTGTTGSRTANGTLAIHEELERQFADWFGKRHAIIFSTGYQANLSLIGGLCGAGDVILAPASNNLDINALILNLNLYVVAPAIFPSSFWVQGGGVASYGVDFIAEGAQAARLVARILRGARPEDLPIEGVNKIELTINRKTAQAFGIAIPTSLQVRVDRVFEGIGE